TCSRCNSACRRETDTARPVPAHATACSQAIASRAASDPRLSTRRSSHPRQREASTAASRTVEQQALFPTLEAPKIVATRLFTTIYGSPIKSAKSRHLCPNKLIDRRLRKPHNDHAERS